MSVLWPTYGHPFGPLSTRARHDELTPFYRLFDDTFKELQHIPTAASTRMATWAPKFDVKETEKEYVLTGEIPGVLVKDVNIELLDDTTMMIRGRTETSREEGHRTPPRKLEQQKEPTSQQQPIMSGANQEAGCGPANQPDISEEQSEVVQDAADKVSDASTEEGVLAQPDSPQSTYWVSERSVGQFQRVFDFPNPVDHDNIRANLKNGVLNVIVSKVESKSASPKKVEIQEE